MGLVWLLSLDPVDVGVEVGVGVEEVGGERGMGEVDWEGKGQGEREREGGTEGERQGGRERGRE